MTASRALKNPTCHGDKKCIILPGEFAPLSKTLLPSSYLLNRTSKPIPGINNTSIISKTYAIYIGSSRINLSKNFFSKFLFRFFFLYKSNALSISFSTHLSEHLPPVTSKTFPSIFDPFTDKKNRYRYSRYICTYKTDSCIFLLSIG